jgi:hypothetical protein
MTSDKSYHRHREQQCRDMAKESPDPEIKRRHEELAELHAGAAERGDEPRP